QRWDLHTGKREAAGQLPALKGALRCVGMGSASVGPLLLASGERAWTEEVLLLNPNTLAALPVDRKNLGIGRFEPDTHTLRASADGTVFGTYRQGSSPQGVEVMVVQGKTVESYRLHKTHGHVVPGPDGRVIYTARGLFTTQL